MIVCFTDLYTTYVCINDAWITSGCNKTEAIIAIGTFPCLIIYLFYFHQDEPAVITLDNIAQFMGQQQRPDVFNINVQAVLKTRDAQRKQDRV